MQERLHSALCIISALVFLAGAALSFLLIEGDGGNAVLGTVIGAVSVANIVFSILMFRRIGGRKWPVAAIFLMLFVAELSGIIELQKRYRIADIITDEAEWDLRQHEGQ